MDVVLTIHILSLQRLLVYCCPLEEIDEQLARLHACVASTHG
jgi:hypothetical protein